MTKLPINLTDLLRQRTVEGERIEYKVGWNPDAIIRTLCIPKILRVMAANGSPAPLFETDEDRISFVIRLPSHPPVKDASSAMAQATAQATKEVKRLLLP